MCGVAAVLLVAVATAVIPLLDTESGTPPAQAAARASSAAQRATADRQWASALCTSILGWKTDIHNDESSLNLGFGPAARVHDAIAATHRLLVQLDQVGLPPGGRTPEGRAATTQLLAGLESRLRTLEGAAGSVAGGDLAAIGTLVGDLGADGAVGAQVISEVRHLASVDLGVSVVETRACRQLAGIPV